MPAAESLKRLGAGRWETRDGRFAIEPQSGTWAVVDATQTNELGLPLVRGPYRSLTEAKEAIEEARQTGPAVSPLGDRIKQDRRAAGTRPPRRQGSTDRKATAASRTRGKAPESAPTPPEPAPEPKWLRDLAPADRRRARDLVERLAKLDIAKAESIVRAEIALDQPALTRLAIERRLRKVATGTKDPADIVRATADILLGGRDRELDVRWRLTDERGRPLTELDLED